MSSRSDQESFIIQAVYDTFDMDNISVPDPKDLCRLIFIGKWSITVCNPQKKISCLDESFRQKAGIKPSKHPNEVGMIEGIPFFFFVPFREREVKMSNFDHFCVFNLPFTTLQPLWNSDVGAVVQVELTNLSNTIGLTRKSLGGVRDSTIRNCWKIPGGQYFFLLQ